TLVTESNETNNVVSIPVTLPSRPDFVRNNASVGMVAENKNGSYSIPVSFTITNNGPSAALPNWSDTVYLSTDGVFDASDLNIGGITRVTALAAGASYTFSTTVTTPASQAPGNYTLFMKTDSTTLVTESNETNNVVSIPVTLPTRPDLVVTTASVGTIVKNGNGSYSIPVTFTVVNNGIIASVSNWLDPVYLST